MHLDSVRGGSRCVYTQLRALSAGKGLLGITVVWAFLRKRQSSVGQVVRGRKRVDDV
jgi:hypothetical protein